MTEKQLPLAKQPVLRVVTHAGDCNPTGTVFGGWLMTQIDIAGSIPAIKVARGRVATVAVNHIQFKQPLLVHDIVSLYADVVKLGNSSITVDVEVYVERVASVPSQTLIVAEARLVFVALDEQGNKRAVPKSL